MATTTINIEIDEDDVLFVDDNRDGGCAGIEIQCAGCDTLVGYPDACVPSTEEEAAAATFIPFVHRKFNSGESTFEDIFCLGCVRAGKR